jgi:CheY-like chemotaxis protein
MDESLRILVIDDGRDARRSCEILLGRFGHSVRTAENGPEGIAICEEFHPHVVICDIRLPQGMTGYDVARTLRQHSDLSEVYLIAQTGFGGEEDVENSLAAGFDRHLTKPVDFNKLTDLLNEIRARTVGSPDCAQDA